MRKKRLLEEIETIQTSQFDLVNTIFNDMKKDFENIRLKDSQVDLFCPSGNASIDFVTSDKIGDGGWPYGRIVEIYGNESTGKSLLANLALIQCIHKQNGVGFLIDTENGFTPSFYRMLGGDPDSLIIYNPKHADDAWDFILKATERVKVARQKSGENFPAMIAYDSLAASPTIEEFEKGMGTVDYGKRAKAHYQGCRLVTEALRENNILLFVVNQLRATLAMFGPDQESVGGKAMKYFASVRCHLKRGQKLYQSNDGDIAVKTKSGAKAGDKFVGIRCKFQIEKTRFTVPFREVEFDLFFKGGLSPFSGWFDALHNHWTDKDGNQRLAIAPSKTDPDKLSRGIYMIDNDVEHSFREKEFMTYLKNHRTDLFAGYHYDDEAAKLLQLTDNVEAIDDEEENVIQVKTEKWDELDSDDEIISPDNV